MSTLNLNDMKDILQRAVLTFCLLLSCISCRKNEEVYEPVDPILKSLLEFQTGSYWIMEDSATNKLDSFVVVGHESYTSSGNTNKQIINIYIVEFDGESKDSIAWWTIKLPDKRQSRILFSNIPIKYVYLFMPGFVPVNTYTSFDSFGQRYDSVVTGQSIGTPVNSANSLKMGVNARNGLLYLNCKIDNYVHNWTIVRGVKK